ncbi:MAG: cbb3-type cytochrome oxidase subunit 3 [Alphaproteobacteria bacterium]
MKNKFWQNFHNFTKIALAIAINIFLSKAVFANTEKPSETDLISNQNPDQTTILLYLQDHAPAIATIFFFLFFCYVVYSVFKKGKEKTFDEYAKIPFKENDNLGNPNSNPAQQLNATDDKNKN